MLSRYTSNPTDGSQPSNYGCRKGQGHGGLVLHRLRDSSVYATRFLGLRGAVVGKTFGLRYIKINLLWFKLRPNLCNLRTSVLFMGARMASLTIFLRHVRPIST